MQNPLKTKLEKLGINTLQLSRAIGLNWHYTTQMINGNRTPSANGVEMILQRRFEAVPRAPQTTKLPQGEYAVMVWGPNKGKKPQSFFLIMEVIDGPHHDKHIAQSFLGYKPEFMDDLLESYEEPKHELRASR